MDVATQSISNDSLKGLFLYWHNEKIIVRKRVKASPKKPTYFLFNLTTKKYISSLYPISEHNHWLFDFNRKAYLFFIDEKGLPGIQLNNNSLI